MKETLKLALEALGNAEYGNYDKQELDKAITAIKEALAQPDYRAVKTYHEGKPVYVSQPEQEPVAWMVYTQEGQSVYVTDNPTDLQESQRALPLYTTPPQRPWVGLTENEIEYWIGCNTSKPALVRAISKALKEKNT